ncbi:MAG TPA: dihydrodipicolinate synthase family protein [Streptosporangiaceae bacterium]|nr:dihydrodipicolinate synthase family protein [Streptosporangiaceae bacterium]
MIPVAPTTFHDDESLDLDSQARVMDFLIDAEVDAVCVLANYSEQFSLTDTERDQVTGHVLSHVAGRLPVVVTTSHYSARIAAERSRRAQQLGADMVMVMPPFFGATLSVDGPAVLDWFRTVAGAIDIPIMVQDAPMSSTRLSAAQLAELATELPAVQYVKVEMPGTAAKLREVIALAGESLPGPFDGEESVTLLPDLDAGARGTMPSCSVPDILGEIVRAYRSGDRDQAVARWEEYLPLIHFENRQCGLRAAKVLLHEGGVITSEATRQPLSPLPEPTRDGLLELARRRDPLVLRWAH